MFSTVTLDDGRTLEYADLGDPAGRPVLFFPGTPATAGQGAVLADAARTHGIRLVATSRPGYGASTNTAPGLTPAAADALELADRLELDRFVAMGTSGGAPYALALAALAPERPASVAVLGGPGSHSEVNPEELEEEDRRAIELMATGDVEGATAILMSWSETNFGPLQRMSADEFSEEFQKTRPPGESWFDSRPGLQEEFEADFHRGIATFDGFVRDNLSWLGAWDFDLAAVTVPVRLVYGDRDGMVPAAHGEWLRERLADSEMRVVPGGHGHATFGGAADTFALLATA
ncbi:MAG TPA: alpha/beta hydrolase [Nocardioides sp.]|nr:alpha/beta hydrolase [Nocardioides sp.]